MSSKKKKYTIVLMWVPGHWGCEDNETDYDFAKKVHSLDVLDQSDSIVLPKPT